MKKKKLTNKDFENRDNILMLEIENVKHILDSLFKTVINYIEYNGDIDSLKKFMQNKEEEAEGVRSEFQKPGS